MSSEGRLTDCPKREITLDRFKSASPCHPQIPHWKRFCDRNPMCKHWWQGKASVGWRYCNHLNAFLDSLVLKKRAQLIKTPSPWSKDTRLPHSWRFLGDNSNSAQSRRRRRSTSVRSRFSSRLTSIIGILRHGTVLCLCWEKIGKNTG